MPPPKLRTDLKSARAWLASRQNPGRAKPDYAAFHDLAEQLHFHEEPRWQVMNIARFLKEQHPEGRRVFAATSLNALHKALSRHLNRPATKAAL